MNTAGISGFLTPSTSPWQHAPAPLVPTGLSETVRGSRGENEDDTEHTDPLHDGEEEQGAAEDAGSSDSPH